MISVTVNSTFIFGASQGTTTIDSVACLRLRHGGREMHPVRICAPAATSVWSIKPRMRLSPWS